MASLDFCIIANEGNIWWNCFYIIVNPESKCIKWPHKYSPFMQTKTLIQHTKITCYFENQQILSKSLLTIKFQAIQLIMLQQWIVECEKYEPNVFEWRHNQPILINRNVIQQHQIPDDFINNIAYRMCRLLLVCWSNKETTTKNSLEYKNVRGINVNANTFNSTAVVNIFFYPRQTIA